MTPANHTFRSAFVATIPVLLGYTAIGLAFGLLAEHAGFAWYIVPAMSLFIYAGAAQFIGIGLMAAGVGILEIGLVIFLVNARHMVYGLSVLEKFKKAEKYKPYLIFALTDETYALLTSTEPPDGVSLPEYYLFVSALNQFYWTAAGVLGFFLGKLLPFSMEGLGFALTALFTVLLIEQFKRCTVRFPFIIAAAAGIAALVLLGKKNMLIAAVAASILVLMLFKNWIGRHEHS